MQYNALFGEITLYIAYMDAEALDSTAFEAAAYLLGIGARVKILRARRGMSRRILAQSSKVSERYLAELESGKGNISILRLRQIANAMGVPTEDLVCDPAAESPEYTYVLQHIRHADPAELTRLCADLSRRRPTRRRLVALIGLRGAGKSTIGAALARRLMLPFNELVAAIEERAGMQTSEIFSLGGQSTYRRFERQCLEESIERDEPGVLAVGGSLVSEPASFERLLETCVTIWLRAEPEDHMNRVIAQGDSRPMADSSRAMPDLKRILAERENLYRRADHIVDTSGRSVSDILNETLGLPSVAEIASNQEVVQV